MSRVEFSHALQELPFEVPRVPCLRVYFLCQGCQVGHVLQEFLLKFQGCHTTCPSSIQWLRGEIICAMPETPIISYVACYSETNGVGDQGIHLDARPPENPREQPKFGTCPHDIVIFKAKVFQLFQPKSRREC